MTRLTRHLQDTGNLLAGRPTLPVSEVFGPTIQGEGPHTGRRCFFVRLGHCNLHCTWCDTPYTWDRDRYDVDAECPPATPPEILERLAALGARPGDTVVLSGGEPLIHHPTLPALLDADYRWHLESNGTIWPGHDTASAFSHVTLSPKIHDQGDPERRRLRREPLLHWAERTFTSDGGVAWKFVIRPGSVHGGIDLTAVEALVRDYGLPSSCVWLMPEGTTPVGILHGTRDLTDYAVARGYNLTTRLHTLIWGDERGH